MTQKPTYEELKPNAEQTDLSNIELENPHLVDGKYSIKDLIDIESLRKTLEKFSLATGFTTGFLEYPSQEILIATGWRDICTKFHRTCPESATHCKESNICLTQQLKQLKELNIKPCENGLVDGATPIVIKGKYIAYLATGQILFDEPDIERFKKQAEMYGYDLELYLEALSEVPVVNEDQLKNALSFLSELAVTIAETGLKNLELKEKTLKLQEEITHRKLAEETLQETLGFNEKILSESPIGISIYDVSGQCISANDSIGELIGTTREQVLQQNYNSIESWKKSGLFDKVKIAIRDNSKKRHELKVKSTFGKDVSLDCHLIPFSTGDQPHLMLMINDITERLRAEEALRQSEKRLDKINECFLSFGIDANENINRLTALCGELLVATCALYNRLDGDMLCSWGQWNTPVDYNPVDTPEGHICYDVIRRAGDETLVITNLSDTHYAQTDPNVIPYKLKTYVGRAVKLRDDYVGSLCAVYQDNIIPGEADKRALEIIASAIGVEEERKRAEEQLNKIFDNTQDAIFIYDLEGNILDVNEKMCAMYKTSKEQACSLSIHDFSSANMSMDVALQRWHRVLKGEKLLFEWEALRPHNGSVFYVEVSLQRISFHEKDIILANVRDITDRKRVEEALRESQRKTETVLNNIPDIILTVSHQGTILSINRHYSAEMTADEIIGKKIYDFVTPGHANRMKKRFERAFQTGKSDEYEELGPGPEGPESRWYIVRLIPIKQDNQVVELMHIATDINERKQAEEALRESEEKYRCVVENIGIGVALISPNMEILALNNQMEKWFPWIDEMQRPICYQSFNDPPRDDICSYCPTYKTLKDGQLHKAVTETPKGNEILYYRVISTPIKDKDGNIISAIEMVEDITESKRAEEALKESEEKYRSMMDAMTDPVYICSSEYKVVYMNPAMILRTGRDGTGEHCYKVINALEEQCPWCVFERVREGQKCDTDIISPKDNRFYHVSNAPIFNKDGSISKMTIYRDITEHKQAERDKRKLESQLQQSQKMEAIGTLAGGIAHDFNNILGAIIGYAELMEMFDVPEDSPMKAKLQEVLKAANRARDLVKQILTFSRQTEQERRPIQLNYIIKETLKFLRASLPTTIEILPDIASEELIAMADPTQMHQVLMNLCTNAGHAMLETGGKLKVELSALNLDAQSAERFLELKPGPHMKLTVSDTGYGMTPEIMERIFDPFFTTKKPGEGTGMGLAVVHGIVKSHEGMITIDSEPGKGTIFQIVIPRIQVEAVEPAIKTAVSVPTGTERILLVDDEHSLVEIVQHLLSRIGYEVTTKTGSTEALELFRSQPERFDLVITDQTMPHMTGIELAQEILKIRSDIPVILCTGYSETATPERIEVAGIRELINKPLEPSSLAQTVRKVLDNK